MFDLDAERSARREALGEAPEFQFGGKTYTLPVELSFTAAMALYRGDLETGLAHVLGQDQYQQFTEDEPSIEDITALAKWLTEEYENRTESVGKSNGNGKTGRGKGRASKA